MIVWGVTDGSAGAEAQVKALAAALKLEPMMKRVRIKTPYVWLPNSFYPASMHPLIPRLINTNASDALTLAWPEMVISCGRRGALAALGIKSMMQEAGKKARFIHIQDPQMDAKHFDLVVAMEHDRVTGLNVIKTPFALHAVTPAMLAEAGQRFAKRFNLYPEPYAAVLIGGSTNKYKLTHARMGEVIASLRRVLDATPGSLLITSSRRTGGENLKALISAFPRTRDSRVYIYDGVGDNPYLGMLALAEHIVVTNDSVNMMSEARATGKPLYILPLPGHMDTKPARLAEKLITQGVARPLSARLEHWDYAIRDEMQSLAAEIRQRLAL